MNAFAPRLGVLVRSAAFQNTALALIVANALSWGSRRRARSWIGGAPP